MHLPATRRTKFKGISGRLPYCVCSDSLTGLLTAVEAGLAAAALAKCSAPRHLKVVGRKDGLPELERLEIVLARASRSKTKPCDVLAELIHDAPAEV